MPKTEPLPEALPDAFRRRQAQILESRRQAALATIQADLAHQNLVRTLLERLESFRNLGPCDQYRNRLHLLVEPLEDRHTVINCFFAEKTDSARVLPVFSVSVVEGLLSVVDRVHEHPADAEDVDSLLDVLYQRMADWVVDFLGPEPDQDLDPLMNDTDEGLASVAASDSPEERSDLRDQTENSPELNVNPGFTVALVPVKAIGKITENMLVRQMSEFSDNSHEILAFEILPAEESKFAVDPLDKEEPREFFRLLLGIRGEHDTADVEALLLGGATGGLLALDDLKVSALAHREEPVFYMQDIIAEIASQIRAGA